MIPIFYRPEQSAKTDSYSPSSSKPALVVEAWLKEFGDKVQVHSFEPATREQFKLAHASDYVDGVLDCVESNGFGNTDKAIAVSLPYTTGSLLAAAKCALETGIAASPTSGAHHSAYGGMYNGVYGGDGAQGFCTFNSLMVAAKYLLDTGGITRAAICDVDQHYGNGTQSIIDVMGLKDKVIHFTAGKSYYSPSQAEGFLKRLPTIIKAMSACDLLIYNAGADSNINDPLGGWLTTEQQMQRDKIVFETCKEIGLPVCWALAGGYQPDFQKVIDIHVNTMKMAIDIYSPLKEYA